MRVDCPTCGAKDVFEANDDTVLEIEYCPRCNRCHVVCFEDGRYWAQRTREPDLEPRECYEGFPD